jgi:SNF2 family DNA or RNA helicase
VYVVSYDTATRDIGTVAKPGALLKMAPASLVLDECHLIKNPNSKRSTHVRRLAHKAGIVVELSGTPITHGPDDLWPALNAMNPNAWPARERYVNRYCEVVSGDYGDKVIGLDPAHEDEFRTALLGQHRRVAKADVLDQLPPKVYSTREVELPAAYRKSYDDLERDMYARLPDGQELGAGLILTVMGQLSLIASAAADVEVTYEKDPETGLDKPHYHVELKAPSWKVDALLEVLDERPDKQTVVFAPSKQLVMLAGQAATAAGYRVGYIVGGQSPKQRTATVDSFQAGELDVVCVTTQAGGVGITLTAASTAVFLQRPWSLVDALQAEDRLHRIGSEIHESIEIIDIVASNTIDSRVRSVLREKAGQLADLVQDPRIVAELLGGQSVTQRGKQAA